MARIVCVEKGTQIQVDDQKRYSHERKPIGSLELSVSLTHSHTVIHSLRISLYISPSLPLSLIWGVGEGEKNRSFDLPVPTSYLSCCSSLHFAYITIVKITRRDIRSEIHALTDENTASLPLFRDRSTIRVVESAPLFLYLRSTRCPRAPRRARESHIFGLRLLTSLRSTIYEQHESTLTRRHTTLQIISLPAAPCFFTSVHTLRTISLHTRSTR